MTQRPSDQISPQERVHPGGTIRKVRHDRQMSLRELARRVGLTPSHLSKIERGLATPSVGALWTISDELRIPVASLFAGYVSPLTRESENAATMPLAGTVSSMGTILLKAEAPSPAVDPTARESIRMAGVEFQRLTPHDDSTIEFIEVRHEVGAGDAEAYHHRGREYGLLLQGRLQVEIGFSKYVLDPGWSVAFDSSNPHRVLNIGEEPAVAIWVVIGRNEV